MILIKKFILYYKLIEKSRFLSIETCFFTFCGTGNPKKQKKIKPPVLRISKLLNFILFPTRPILFRKQCLIGSGDTLLWRDQVSPPMAGQAALCNIVFSYFSISSSFVPMAANDRYTDSPEEFIFIFFLGPPLGILGPIQQK